MSNLQRVEKIERELFRQGNFVLKNTILTGKKSANGMKLDPMYKRTYDSKKYNNYDKLDQITITSSDYMVMAYNNFERKVSEEIFVSYPNMIDLKSFTANMLNMVMSNKVFDSRNQVAMEYKEYQLTSQPLAGGKVLVAIPTPIEKDQNLTRGVYLFFNSEDNYIELDVKGVFTLNEIVKSIDLLSLSNATMMLGMLSNMGSSEDIDDFGSASTPAPRSPLANRGLFGNNRNNFSPRKEATGNAPTVTPEESDNPFDNDLAPAPSPTMRKPEGNKPSGGLAPRGIRNNTPVPAPTEESSSGVLSMENIMAEAENMDFNPADDEELLDF